jgi:hypothetical protein
MFVVMFFAQAIFIATLGQPGEVAGYLETAIVQLYGSAVR